MEAILKSVFRLDNIALITTTLSCFLFLLFIRSVLLRRDPAVRRAQSLRRYRNELLQANAITKKRRSGVARSQSFMRTVVERLALNRSNQAKRIVIKLLRAGLRNRDALNGYLFFKMFGPIFMGGLVIVFIYILPIFSWAPFTKLMASWGLVLIAAYAPDMVLRNMTKKRWQKIKESYPDALDLMGICAESGLGLDATLVRVSNEMSKGAPEISDEFGLTGIELGFLPDRRTAFDNLVKRIDIPYIRSLSNVLTQSERYGTPLAQSLRVLSRASREERILSAEERAARLPALLTVPMILFIFPPLFIVILAPGVLRIMDSFTLL